MQRRLSMVVEGMDQEGGDKNRCAICNSRIDELDIVLAGNLGVS